MTRGVARCSVGPVDRMTPAARSALMRRIRAHGSAAERTLLSALRRIGILWGVANDAETPGTPDVCFRRERVAVFVDGCFWHSCPRHGSTPKTRVGYWREKLAYVQEHDAHVRAHLAVLGWTVVRLWEHEVLAAPEAAAQKVARSVLVVSSGARAA